MENELAVSKAEGTVTLKKTVDSLISEMEKIVVDSDEKYSALEAWLRRNKEQQKVIVDYYEADRVRTKAAYDAITGAKSALIKPLEAAEEVTRKRMGEWSTKREKERREELARIEEAKRLEREPDVLEEAVTLEAMGRGAQADALLERGAKVTKTEVLAAATVSKVGKTMEKWTVQVVDVDMFLSSIAGMGLIQECISINTSALAALFKKNGTKSFPGLKVDQTFVPVL